MSHLLLLQSIISKSYFLIIGHNILNKIFRATSYKNLTAKDEKKILPYLDKQETKQKRK